MDDPKALRHEIEVMLCSLVAEWVSQDRGGIEFRVDETQPDVSDRQSPAADLECHDSLGRILVEHTQLDHFEGAVPTAVILERMFGDYGVCVDRPDGAQWQLCIPEPWLRAKRKKSQGAGIDLTNWVQRELADESNFEHASTVRLLLDGQGSPFLRRWTTHPIVPQSDGRGRVRVTIQVGDAEWVEQQRGRIAEKVLRHKVRKFRQPTAQDATSVLVIEDRDFSMGPVPIPTSKAFAAAAECPVSTFPTESCSSGPYLAVS